ncbi:hypothetical protein KI387_006095, partial [Taxus chinensis]
ISLKIILLQLPHPPGSKADDSKSGGDVLSILAGSKGGALLMVFHIYIKKGNHWTSKWTYKDLTPAGATNTLTMDKDTKGITTGGSSASGTATYFATRKSTYVPLNLRGVIDRSSDTMHHKNDENSNRVTNLTEDTMDVNLHKLFNPFGHITCVYVAMDQKMGVSRGFGFVNFVNMEDA